ncbi:YeiH family protein [Natronospira bacteriovora]|uniref:Sulfate exporter family transporter n=1 Tax=Natronospira bacteriovora TaxID=3069753 RepID=A0ABU0W736_9GAMM|nr:putative sulfate exporter family transporter [Natronospira sp. AB-CW4]MDQ2069767.1 putative sulfate exporter family transporter [Natronospira sp. AB-CW4]
MKKQGLLLATTLGVSVSLVAWWLSQFEAIATRLPVSAALLAILLGLALAPWAARRPGFGPGLKFAAGDLLKLGVVLLGLRLSLAELWQIGASVWVLVLLVIVSGLLLMALLSRLLALPARLGILLGVGTAICGASAIAATAPGIQARSEETAYAIACVALFGLLATLAYPLLFHFLLDDPRLVGMALGAAIHDTAQVTGAALMYEQSQQAPEALSSATVTKLMRNLGILAVVPLAIWWARRGEATKGAGPAFPLFILGFIALVGLRSLGDALFGADQAHWQQFLSLAGQLSALLFAIALAAMGLGIRLSALRALGPRPAIAALSTAVLVGVVAIAWLQFFMP